jgi:hypothetical protein
MLWDYTSTLTNYNNVKKLTKAHNNLRKMYGSADFSYCDAELKRGLHKDSAAYLRMLAEQLELPEGSYEIRLNEGGIAGSGEITLHSDNLYVQISQWAGYEDLRLLIRGCRSRTDFTGHENHALTTSATPTGVVRMCKACRKKAEALGAERRMSQTATKTVNVSVSLDVTVHEHFSEEDINDITFEIPVGDITAYTSEGPVVEVKVEGYTTQEYYADP